MFKKAIARIARRYGYIPLTEATAAVAAASQDVAVIEATRDIAIRAVERLETECTGQIRVIGTLLNEIHARQEAA